MSDQWVEGEPKSDGLYACVWTSRPGDPNIGVGKLLVRIREGKRYAPSHENVEGNPHECCWNAKILRHYRLPEPTRPLELPRRFRAKYGGLPVVGVRGVPGKSLAVFDRNGYVGFTHEHELADIVWEDQP
jgi:hypothetical protein